ncbi:carboxymuconolactone decarboxylase family protein [Sinomicrobium pectinilyticum]|uniref:Carboxymuconolactone decarboxylase family protein n=1 Tax=Sinomicrobium pectinilyticum TaxID=1084421 RepID=A0A3N0EPN9_SINP1|nr:carboxymuconolactone decarboxylase family protein [Sinomicrobium pectinilyticum]RNL89868.1 carboxymuconolactone decarboxylase family protein [Sinomicrobium pectinilyticum]
MTTTAKNGEFSIPTRAEVSAKNQAIFDQLQKSAGFVPNLYAYMAKNETALGDYLVLQNRKSTLRGKEREVINLVTSQINHCKYCLSAHTVLGKLHGFTDEQILEIREGRAAFDNKLDGLAKFTAAVVERKGKVSEEVKENFFVAGYTEANLIDAVIIIGDKIITNYIHNLTEVEIDFPLAEDI